MDTRPAASASTAALIAADAPAEAVQSGDAPAGPIFRTVDLDKPLKRGAQVIDKVTLRKPDSGELRGLSLVEVANLDVNSLHKLLPRISNPVLTEADCRAMDPADLLALGAEVSGFLLQKRNQPDFPAR